MSGRAIGIFDSGVGGFSVVKALRALLPEEKVLFFADQAHVPYGERPREEVLMFCEAITRFLLERGAGMIVVACNTASAAALHELRRSFAPIPFVGMEPAVKPAAEATLTGKVGVLATPATFQGALYASVVERFASHVTIYQDTCPGLVQQIEKGELGSEGTRAILERSLRPMLEAGIDTVVMGCTHYPFVIPLIREVAGEGVRVIDPAPAIARRVQQLLALQTDRTPPAKGSRGDLQVFTSGDEGDLERLLPVFLGEKLAVRHADWDGSSLRA